jgi:hypothetical protein
VANHRFFIGDGAFHDRLTYRPLNVDELEASGNDPALVAYNDDFQLHRSRVEHAIQHPKSRFGALKGIDGNKHMLITDICNLIFLSWLLDARYQRINGHQ